MSLATNAVFWVLFVIYYIYPAKQELAFFRSALYRLGGGDYGHPFLNILLRGVVYFTEQVEVFVCSGSISGKAEEQVGAGCIGGAVSLGDVRPIENVMLSVGTDYHV